MGPDRYVVLGLAQVRSSWFAEVGRWATSAMLPLEFVKAMSLEEVRVRLRSGRGHSALLVDDSVVGLDRDLVEVAREAGCAVVVVETGRGHRRTEQLGAAAVLPAGFGREDLLAALAQVATPIERHGLVATSTPDPTDAPGYRGHLVAVTGAGGTGRSTVAMGLAQGLARDVRWADVTCLADLSLHAQQGLVHAAGDVVPGVSELVEAHRGGAPSAEAIRAVTWRLPERRYHLLLGLRRHRDWTAVRPHAFAAALDGLRRSFRMVVADVDADVEGERATGSVDVEDRNAIARATVQAADLVLVVGRPGVTGIHGLLRTVTDVLELGVEGRAVLPVCNRAPRRPAARAEIANAFGSLLAAGADGHGVPSPVHLPERRSLETAVRDGVPLPASWVAPLARSVDAILARRPPRSAAPTAPIPVRPGSLGTWTEPGPEPTS
jgi:hypothetical protein